LFLIGLPIDEATLAYFQILLMVWHNSRLKVVIWFHNHQLILKLSLSCNANIELRQCELLPSLGIRRPLTFHILIFSSEIPQPNKQKLGRKNIWKVFYKDCGFRGEESKKSANQKQESPVAAMFVTDRDE
jgi:hypothetical protein